jgi:hypothetical protein
MSKLYVLSRPWPEDSDEFGLFARMGHIGTWDPSRSSCGVSNRVNAPLIHPLLIEWEAGSDRLGDFS